MTTWAEAAVQSAARASGTRGGILHYITPGVLDGFAAGALLTGLILLLLVVPRMRRRSRPDYFAGPVDGDGFGTATFEDADQVAMRQIEPEPGRESGAHPSDRRPYVAAASADRATASGLPEAFAHQDSGHTHHRSKHRMTGPGNADRRPDARQSQPRHAAPSTGLSS